MMCSRSLSALVGLVVLAVLVVTPVTASAQDQREIDLIAELGQEEIARRQAIAAAEAEAAHRALLEEQSRLRAIYKEYLGDARRAAQQAIAKKRRGVSEDDVRRLRSQAKQVIQEVTDQTKGRVRSELDPIYEQLESAIAITPDDLLAANPDLAALRKRLTTGNKNDLDWVDQTAILYALCPDKNQAEIIAGNVQFRDQLSDDEAQAIDLCNRRRLVLGLHAVGIDMKLVEASRDHSNDMKTLGFFAHQSPVAGKTTPWDRAKNFGTKASGENIAAGYNSGTAVTMGWWYSPGHLKNMMNAGHRRVAVGQQDKHYTQMFGN